MMGFISHKDRMDRLANEVKIEMLERVKGLGVSSRWEKLYIFVKVSDKDFFVEHVIPLHQLEMIRDRRILFDKVACALVVEYAKEKFLVKTE